MTEIILIILAICVSIFVGMEFSEKESKVEEKQRLMTQCQEDYKEYECYIKLGEKK